MSSDKRGRASAGAARAAAVASAISLNAMLAGIEREGSRILSAAYLVLAGGRGGLLSGGGTGGCG